MAAVAWIKSLRLHSRSRVVVAIVAAIAVMATSLAVWRSDAPSELAFLARDGATWVASSSHGGVSLLDGATGSIVTALTVTGPGDDYDVIDWNDDAVIVNRSTGTIARLAASTWEIPTGRIQISQPGQPMTAVFGSAGGWIVHTNSVSSVSTDQLSLLPAQPMADPLVSAAVAPDGSLLYASEPGIPVRRFGRSASDRTDVDGLSGRISFDELSSTVVSGVGLDDPLVWIDGKGVVCDQLEFADDAEISVGGAADHLFVISNDGAAFMWNPVERGCPDPDADFAAVAPGTFGEPVMAEGWGAVPDIATGEVLIIRASDQLDPLRVQLPDVAAGDPIELIAEANTIWYNDQTSNHAGIIRPDGKIIPIEKYGEDATGFTPAVIADDPPPSAETQVAGVSQTPDETTTTTAPESGEAPAGPAASPPPTTAPNDAASPTTAPTTAPVDPGATTTPVSLDGASPLPAETTTTLATSAEESTTVPERPTLDLRIALTAKEVVAGGTIRFVAQDATSQATSFRWTFSPAENEVVRESGASTERRFTRTGRVGVTVEACDQNNRCATARETIDVVEDPALINVIAAFTTPASVLVGESVRMVDVSQGSPDTWSWTFDGGSPATSTQTAPAVSWSTPGTKQITLTVKRGSASDTVTKTITVEGERPPAAFALVCSQATVPANEWVTCRLDGEVNNFTNIGWTITPSSTEVDSSSGSGQRLVRLAAPGTISVRLAATDKVTNEARTATTSITVTAAKVVEPSVSIQGPATVTAGTAASFTAVDNNANIETFSWSGEGTPTIGNRSGASTLVTWSAAGTYQLSVTATAGGRSVTATKQVTVEPATPLIDPPKLRVTWDGRTHSCVDQLNWTIVQSFNDGGPVDSYAWSFGGVQPRVQSLDLGDTRMSIQVCNVGTTTVSVTATGPGGTSTASVSVRTEYFSSPAVDSISGPTSLVVGQSASYSSAIPCGGSVGGCWPYTYSWDMGDNRTSPGTKYYGDGTPSLTTSWSTPGTYVLRLSVSNPLGSSSGTLTVTVTAPTTVPTTTPTTAPTTPPPTSGTTTPPPTGTSEPPGTVSLPPITNTTVSIPSTNTIPTTSP